MALEQIDQYSAALMFLIALNVIIAMKYNKAWIYAVFFLVFGTWFGVETLVKGDISYVFPLTLTGFCLVFNFFNIVKNFNGET